MPAEGFLLVDKPGGWTSHDVVAKVRGLAATKKVGHAGTLDPMATGLLVLGLGRATRLLRFVQEAPKEYVARARFGVGTDSLDADGTETHREPMPVSEEAVAAALEAFRGDIEQIPPMTSAIKIGGQKLYQLARRGEEIERPPRPVHIYELELVGFEAGDYPLVEFGVVCSSGTYVRTLGDDIARALGGRAHLVELRRTRIGALHVTDAVAMDELAAGRDRVDRAVLALSEGLADLGRLTVDDDLGRRISHGSVLSPAELPIDRPTAVLDRDGNVLAVYDRRGSEVRPEVVLT
jgi:tRNA pseudouridine55 synthase